MRDPSNSWTEAVLEKIRALRFSAEPVGLDDCRKTYCESTNGSVIAYLCLAFFPEIGDEQRNLVECFLRPQVSCVKEM